MWRPDWSTRLEPLPVKFVEEQLIQLRWKPWKYGTPRPEPGFSWGAGPGTWSRNRPAGGRAPPRPHRRPGTHASGGPLVLRRRARRDRHLEMGDVPGVDRPVARRAATPAGVGAASLPRRRPPLAPDLVAGYSAERPRTHAPQQKRGRSQGRHRPSPSSKSVHLAFPGGLDREHPFWGTRIGPQQIGDPRRITRPPPPGRPASARLRSA